MQQSSISYQTQVQAQQRRQLIIRNVQYNLQFSLHKGERFEGRTTINFSIDRIEDTFIDYKGEGLKRLCVNGMNRDTVQYYDNNFVQIQGEWLIIGQNEVVIEYERRYSNDGCGLHSFIDTDKKQYIYSCSAPYYANKYFPCFDQPDIKGTYNSVIYAPVDWIVLSNEAEVTTTNDNDDIIEQTIIDQQYGQYRKWVFGVTCVLSTYLYAICAGPFQCIVCPQEYRVRDISMSLYCRDSLLKYLRQQAQELFMIMQQGIYIYEKIFDYKFPFNKYDSVFCPEFKYGAMENPGLVSYSDNFIFKEEVLMERRLRRASTFTHELAHMWFGNLVTMKWWNDLWLNESFADFICIIVLQQISNVPKLDTAKAPIISFQKKCWGYTEDQKITTHPIACDIPNTEKAETIFDGITYSKGAATLKQLMYLIGQQNFYDGVSIYFKKYQWSNATLENLLECMQSVISNQYNIQQHPELDLVQWRQDWLCQAGLNEVQVYQWDTTNNKIILQQTGFLSEYQTLRYHKFRLGLVNQDSQIINVEDIVLQNKQYTTIQYTYIQQQQICAIIPNYQDYAFIKVIFDETSFKYLSRELYRIDDELTRLMIWRSFYEQVKDTRMSGVDYIYTVLQNIEREQSISVLESIYTYVESVYTYIPHSIIKQQRLYEQVFESTLRLLIQSINREEQFTILVKGQLVNFIRDEEHIYICKQWYEKAYAPLQGISPTALGSWKIIASICRSTKIPKNEKLSILNKKLQLDSTDIGKNLYNQCIGILAESTEREALWKSFLDINNKNSLQVTNYYMIGFNDYSNISINTLYHSQFFSELIPLFVNRDKEYSKKFYQYLFPKSDDLTWLLEQVQNVLESCPDNQEWLKILLTESQDTLQVRIKCYELVQKSLL